MKSTHFPNACLAHPVPSDQCKWKVSPEPQLWLQRYRVLSPGAKLTEAFHYIQPAERAGLPDPHLENNIPGDQTRASMRTMSVLCSVGSTLNCPASSVFSLSFFLSFF